MFSVHDLSRGRQWAESVLRFCGEKRGGSFGPLFNPTSRSASSCPRHRYSRLRWNHISVRAFSSGLRKMHQKVYCSGPLLEAVQSMRIFPDCKHFVDMPMKFDAETTLSNWDRLVQSVPLVDSDTLRRFVDEHFEAPGCELEEYIPEDWIMERDPFARIEDPFYRAWAFNLHGKWPLLTRRIRQEVLNNPDRYSLIPLPHPFVVPGGRFRELYYWDSFFTIKGLFASGMLSTVRGMILNMMHLVEKYGFVPNGNRIYYLNRSQPPLLTWCVYEYWKESKDTEFMSHCLPVLRKEMSFFDANRRMEIDGHGLYHHRVDTLFPRPESYREDVECALDIEDEDEKRRLWCDIAAAAESGRDFSARWFTPNAPPLMVNTRTASVIPVDLNAIIAGNLRMSAEMSAFCGEEKEAAEALTKRKTLCEAIHKVLWNEEEGCWFDWDLSRGCHLAAYFDSNFFPLYTECFHPTLDPLRIVTYLDMKGALQFPGGVPSSLLSSGQQWDFPNAWAPTTWVMIEGLRKIGQHDLAFEIADKWIRRNFSVWKMTGGTMFEKYNVEGDCVRAAGGGGEYEVQEGFGWTNGVILDLLTSYGHKLVAPVKENCPCCIQNKENCPLPSVE